MGFKTRPSPRSLTSATHALDRAEKALSQARASAEDLRQQFHNLLLVRLKANTLAEPVTAPTRASDDERERLASLSPREREVLTGLALGHTHLEIAGRASISVRTVDSHRLNVIAKLKLRNNAELARFAIRHGLVTA